MEYIEKVYYSELFYDKRNVYLDEKMQIMFYPDPANLFNQEVI